MIYKDDDEIRGLTYAKLKSWHGRYLTWDLLAEIGIEPPRLETTKAFLPCPECKKALGTYRKGFCKPCYILQRDAVIDLKGRRLHPKWGCPSCEYCHRVNERSYECPAGSDTWYCMAHAADGNRVVTELTSVTDKFDKIDKPSESPK